MGIPISAILNDQTVDNAVRKEIVYKELDRVPVSIIDTDRLSPRYLRITYLPEEFKLGKNLIKIRPDIPLFVESSQLYVEIIDYNGNPIYHEIELNTETNDNFIIISVYIYEDTPPGPCAVYILGTLRNTVIPENNLIYPVNFRWANIINVDITEKTTSPIIFTTLPKVTILANTASYDILSYPGNSPFTSSTYYNLQLNNGLLNPSITPLNTEDIFSSSMYTGDIKVKYEDIQLISPVRFTTNILLGAGVTASIKNFITSKSLELDEPIVIYQQNKAEQIILKSAIFKTASINYEQDSSGIVQSTFKKRKLDVLFEDLDPFVSQIRSIKTFYRDTALKTTEYLLLSDFIVPSQNVHEGFNPITASFSLILPDSEINERYDIRFEFYNNENVPSKQVLELRDIEVEGISDVIVNDDGIIMVDPVNSTLDGKNMVRTLYNDYDIHTLYTSQSNAPANSLPIYVQYPTITYPAGEAHWPTRPDFSQSLADFTAFIPGGSDYVTLYYNASIINSRTITSPNAGTYAYNIKLSAVLMSTASYFEFDYPNDFTQSIVSSSISTITLDSSYTAGHMAIGYPVRHVMKLPFTNQLIRFKLEHFLNTGDNFDVTGNPVSYEVTASIKDINILSSGFLFYSSSLQTYVSGAYDYSTPSP